MRVLVSGANGLVGGALVPALAKNGFEVKPLVRAHSSEGMWWNTETGEINRSAIDEWQPQAMVHLAGEGIATKRWNTEQKERIRKSRVEATERLASSLLALSHPPAVFVSASAVGYYGNRADELLTEASPPGKDFLADVVRDWEGAASSLREAGVRVVHLRFGMIVSASGGALKKMLPAFKLGIGGRLGDGKQWLSWIALTDLVRLVEWALANEAAAGAYNAVSPKPVTNREWTRELAKVLKRPAIFPAPAPLLRVAFGEMADAVLLASQRAVPQRLLSEGFRFRFVELAEALGAELSG